MLSSQSCTSCKCCKSLNVNKVSNVADWIDPMGPLIEHSGSSWIGCWALLNVKARKVHPGHLIDGQKNETSLYSLKGNEAPGCTRPSEGITRWRVQVILCSQPPESSTPCYDGSISFRPSGKKFLDLLMCSKIYLDFRIIKSIQCCMRG